MSRNRREPEDSVETLAYVILSALSIVGAIFAAVAVIVAVSIAHHWGWL